MGWESMRTKSGAPESGEKLWAWLRSFRESHVDLEEDPCGTDRGKGPSKGG